MKPLHYYFLGTGAWFLSYGIQTVAFAWLVTIVLHEPASLVGVAQMTFLLPAMLLMLVGGSLADQFGGRRLALFGHLAASCAPLLLIVCILFNAFSYPVLLVYAVVMGCAQAFITPARDGLLAQLSGGRIQKLVVQVSMIQFGIQMFGFIAASYADSLGAVFVLSLQSLCLAMGAVFYARLDLPTPKARQQDSHLLAHIRDSVIEGYRTVRGSPAMSTIVFQNCAMGLFFMGSYLVTIPLLLREAFDGSSNELSWVNAANSFGLVVTILVLLRLGHVRRPGRALLSAHVLGCFALAGAGLNLGWVAMLAFIFAWGMSGGIGMTMSRTIMQEQAPSDQRARMMAFFSFSFMGAGPVGALLSGFLVEWLGASQALMVSSTMMLLVVVLVRLRTRLWHLESQVIHETGDTMAKVSSEQRSVT